MGEACGTFDRQEKIVNDFGRRVRRKESLWKLQAMMEGQYYKECSRNSMRSSILSSSSFVYVLVADYCQKTNVFPYFVKRRQLSGFQDLCNMELAVALLSVQLHFLHPCVLSFTEQNVIFHTSEFISSRYLYGSCSYVSTQRVTERQMCSVSFVMSIVYFQLTM